MKKLFLALSLLAVASPGIAQNNAFITDSLDTYIVREMQRWTIPGLSIAVIKDGKILVNKGYGIREAGKPGKVDEHTLFQVASNSKAFTGTALAMLEQQKRFSLDDKVTRWIPDFQLEDDLASRDVTVRDLLCHRIGFGTFQGDFLNWNSNLPRKELIHRMRFVDPLYSFRSRYGYCNSAYLTAGEVIPAVTDTSWDDYIRAHFFQPLNMQRSSTKSETIYTAQNTCKAHTLVEGRITIIPYANVDNLGPAASIVSSANDLANWLLMQLDSGRFNGNEVVPFAALQATRRSQTVVNDITSKYFPGRHFQTYGLGWFMEDYYGKKVIQHDGGANGFVTTTCFVPELGLGIVVLTNTDANSLYAALRYQLIEAFMDMPYRNISQYYHQRNQQGLKQEQESLAKERAIAAKKHIPDLPLDAYRGTYYNPVYGEMTVRKEKGKLSLHFAHHPFLIGKLESQGGHNFLCTYSDPTYGVKKIPFTVEQNKVKSVTITVNDFIDMLPYEFTRKN